METTTIDNEFLLLTTQQFRSLQPLPSQVQDQHFSAELHLVHQVVARRILGASLYEALIADVAFGLNVVIDGPNQILLQLLRPCLAAWTYQYALPNFAHLLTPAIANTKGDNLLKTNPQLNALRVQTRRNAEVWTQHLVQHLLNNPDHYPSYEVCHSARTYIGSPTLP
jgi:hypothetical protein